MNFDAFLKNYQESEQASLNEFASIQESDIEDSNQSAESEQE